MRVCVCACARARAHIHEYACAFAACLQILFASCEESMCMVTFQDDFVCVLACVQYHPGCVLVSTSCHPRMLAAARCSIHRVAAKERNRIRNFNENMFYSMFFFGFVCLIT